MERKKAKRKLTNKREQYEANKKERGNASEMNYFQIITVKLLFIYLFAYSCVNWSSLRNSVFH